MPVHPTGNYLRSVRSALSRRLASQLLVMLVCCLGTPAGAGALDTFWQGIEWGESSRAVFDRLGPRATALPSPIDFGDTYSNVVLRGVTIGGVPLVVFYQMDKATGGLKRIQLERQRHGVNPPAFRAILGALEADYGAPDALCGAWPNARSGYQAAAERVWHRGGVVIRAIFRDTTIEAFEGCFAGDPGAGPCGLTGQLLIRISPSAGDGGACAAPPLSH